MALPDEDREFTIDAEPLLDEFMRMLDHLTEVFEWTKATGDAREALYWAGCVERWAALGEYLTLVLKKVEAHQRLPPWPSGPTPRTRGRSVAGNAARKAAMRTMRRM